MKALWEILVPTVRPNSGGKKFFTTRYHRVWDEKVRAITGGLTIMPPAKGEWVSPASTFFRERMIPVRVMADREQIERVISLTLDYYDQEAVLCYKLADETLLRWNPKYYKDPRI